MTEEELAGAIKALVDAGFLYETRKATATEPALYAVTWEPVTDTEGLDMSGFKPHAYLELERGR